MIALLTIIFSFIGALICGLMPACAHRRIRWVALLTAGLGLAAAFCCALRYTGPGMEDVISRTWIPSMGVGFLTGFDGISLPLLLVTGLVAVAGVLFTWKLDHRANQFYAFYFALIGGVYGVFLSMDLFLLFVFYEIAIVPKYFLIAIWGGAKREYAAMKLVMYSFGGSALVLIGMLALFFASGLNTFDLRALMTVDFSSGLQSVVFPVMFVGFAILAGMWPFHTWAPQGHSAAPTAVSMLLAGVVMKLGAYGCLRVAVGLMPEGAMVWAPWVAVFAVINIIYGALAALRQDDFKWRHRRTALRDGGHGDLHAHQNAEARRTASADGKDARHRVGIHRGGPGVDGLAGVQRVCVRAVRAARRVGDFADVDCHQRGRGCAGDLRLHAGENSRSIFPRAEHWRQHQRWQRRGRRCRLSANDLARKGGRGVVAGRIAAHRPLPVVAHHSHRRQPATLAEPI